MATVRAFAAGWPAGAVFEVDGSTAAGVPGGTAGLGGPGEGASTPGDGRSAVVIDGFPTVLLVGGGRGVVEYAGPLTVADLRAAVGASS
ncbi:hypothetical protein MMPV_007509 [Pyropia vietnamensis]